MWAFAIFSYRLLNIFEELKSLFEGGLYIGSDFCLSVQF